MLDEYEEDVKNIIYFVSQKLLDKNQDNDYK